VGEFGWAPGREISGASRSEKQKILDEFVALTGCPRKQAIRVLSCERVADLEAKARKRIYDEAARQVLILLWEAADRVCGKRLTRLLLRASNTACFAMRPGRMTRRVVLVKSIPKLSRLDLTNIFSINPTFH
jgi:hypothetical protein